MPIIPAWIVAARRPWPSLALISPGTIGRCAIEPAGPLLVACAARVRLRRLPVWLRSCLCSLHVRILADHLPCRGHAGCWLFVLPLCSGHARNLFARGPANDPQSSWPSFLIFRHLTLPLFVGFARRNVLRVCAQRIDFGAGQLAPCSRGQIAQGKWSFANPDQPQHM